MTTLAGRLKEAREFAGLSQSGLARLVGVKPQSIQAIESGRAKKSRYVGAFADALGVRPEWLDSGAGPMVGRERPLTPEQRRAAEIVMRLSPEDLKAWLRFGSRAAGESAAPAPPRPLPKRAGK